MTGSTALNGAGTSLISSSGGPPSMVRASLEVFTPVPVSGSGAKPGGKIGSIPFQFNPKELTIEKKAHWEAKTTRGSQNAPPPDYRGAEPSKLSLEMFFDASAKQDNSVVQSVEALFTCLVPTKDSHEKKNGHPPLVVFQWGSISSFAGNITSVSAKYTLFTPTGTPIRATCTVTLQEMARAPGKQNPTSGGLAVRQLHTVVEGDTLASVAFKEYGDPNSWRALARANGIDDPLRVLPGTSLLVPAAEELVGLR
jgi:nucleoid-associated protein YgaU